MTSKAATISEYLEELPPDRRAALGQLRFLIHRIAPKTVEAMKYGLPSFGELCALASQKNYMALYVCESDIVKAHLAQLGKVSCGKGCIRFKRIDDLNLSAVESILKDVLKLRSRASGQAADNSMTALRWLRFAPSVVPGRAAFRQTPILHYMMSRRHIWHA
jgi:uncharacterized protein YdhG (YjbR/CyaY superfamily)